MRDLRRIQLARRMIQHEVRTTTICTWTGLNEDRIRNLIRSYQSTAEPARRHRGPPPKRIDVFLRYNIVRAEAACLGGLARAFGLVPPAPVSDAGLVLPGVGPGEVLCHTFELYRAVVAEARLTMEHFILLVVALAERQEIELDHCAHCTGVILVEVGRRDRRICFACGDTQRARTNARCENGDAGDPPPRNIQHPLF